MAGNRILSRLGLLALPLALAACGEAGVGAGESGTDGIEYRVIQNRFSMGAHGVHLLEAAVAATHTCCKN